MVDEYDKGIAFVFEGDTEKCFYIELLKYFCDQHEGYEINKCMDLSGTDYFYTITSALRKLLVRVNCVGTVTQITNSGNWFNKTCALKHSKIPWDVFLCYDTDSYNASITKFHSGDWKDLRKILVSRKNIRIVDMAASAEIEDLFLTDLEGISKYLSLKKQLLQSDIPSGGKGKSKLKRLFRLNGFFYHEGNRALDLIRSLNMNVIIGSGILPLSEIERSCFY